VRRELVMLVIGGAIFLFGRWLQVRR
jgi:hypothetical protein